MKNLRLLSVLSAMAVVFLGLQTMAAQENKPRQGNGQQEMRRGEKGQPGGGHRGRRRRGQGERSQNGRRGEGGLKVGQPAPTFVLKSLDGESETNLATFKDNKPVVLFFGSYT